MRRRLLAVDLFVVVTVLLACQPLSARAAPLEPPVPAPETEPSTVPAAAKPAKRRPLYGDARIDDLPHVKQKPDFCGEACAAMYLAKLGYAIDQDDVFIQAGVDPELGRGSHTKDLRLALLRIGFDVGPVWFHVAVAAADQQLETLFQSLHRDLTAGVPSIVCMRYDAQPETTEHFRLIVGFDGKTDEVLYHEPAFANAAYRRMPRSQFLELWPLKYEEDRWTVIRLRLAAGTLRDVHSTAKLTVADYAQQVIAAKRKAPEGFAVLIQKPFVVIGDESPEQVRRRATGTIRWAIDRLQRAYFPELPDEILDIWLFKDKESYNKHTEEIFGTPPHTPFGYYSHRDKALIMNIDTGGGTLVHEIVHPFMAANFPECPAWFNEGLASLYEQCGDHRGRIWGYTNWRLEGLQAAIAPKPEAEPEADSEAASTAESASRGNSTMDDVDDTTDDSLAAEDAEPAPEPLPSFKTLCHTTTREFYWRDPGTNYSQARYLCYYLQQRGLLGKYYQQFRDNVQDDPSGYETLKAVLGITDDAGMERFQESWKAWILTLEYP